MKLTDFTLTFSDRVRSYPLTVSDVKTTRTLVQRPFSSTTRANRHQSVSILDLIVLRMMTMVVTTIRRAKLQSSRHYSRLLSYADSFPLPFICD